jgi:chemotaxis protein methyltransferase CheR
MSQSNLAMRSARSAFRFIRSRLFYNTLMLPLARAKHRELLRTTRRSDSHTYTAFYRSPRQLEALTGPVLEHLERNNVDNISLLILAGSNGAEAYTIASELLYRRPKLRFSIRASDLHAETVAKACSATYTLQEITQGLAVPTQFIERTFDKSGESYVVKPHIRERIVFERADLLDANLDKQFAPADIVVAQNVLFHMPPEMARRAFANVLKLLKPGSVLLIDGMELDMRVELVKPARLVPLDFNVREIYEYSRRHIPENWWDYYYGNEPYFAFARDRLYRYGTVFIKS